MVGGRGCVCVRPASQLKALFTQPTTSDGILIIIRKHIHTDQHNHKEKEAKEMVGGGEGGERKLEMGTRTHVE